MERNLYSQSQKGIAVLACGDGFVRIMNLFTLEIVNEFLMSTGYLPGAHDENCTIFEKAKALNPKWLEI